MINIGSFRLKITVLSPTSRLKYPFYSRFGGVSTDFYLKQTLGIKLKREGVKLRRESRRLRGG